LYLAGVGVLCKAGHSHLAPDFKFCLALWSTGTGHSNNMHRPDTIISKDQTREA
jgi:hypothetical protein